MNKTILAALAIASAMPLVPAVAQTASEQARFDAAQRRYDNERGIYQQEVDRYQAARRAHPYRGPRPGYGDPRPGYPDPRSGDPRYADSRYADERDEAGYDASRYYREGPNYQERTLSADDRVYRGNDGRYYCKRNDGTTGLIIGGAGGAILGNVIDGGHSRVVGTLLGGALGAIAGKSIDQNNSQVKCR